MGGPRLRHTFLRVLGPRSARRSRPVSVFFCGSACSRGTTLGAETRAAVAFHLPLSNQLVFTG